jgi:hypothetical protein
MEEEISEYSCILLEPFLRKNLCKMAEPRGHRGGTDPLLKLYGTYQNLKIWYFGYIYIYT